MTKFGVALFTYSMCVYYYVIEIDCVICVFISMMFLNVVLSSRPLLCFSVLLLLAVSCSKVYTVFVVPLGSGENGGGGARDGAAELQVM